MSKKGHVPIRMCVGCGRRRSKEEMIRLIKTPGRLFVPKDRKDGAGRSLYLCPNFDCLREAERKKRVATGVVALDLGSGSK